MTGASKIAWTDATWNPSVGCSRVSPGCDRCYAMGQAPRQAGRGLYDGVVADGDWTGRVNLAGPEDLDWPLRRRRPARIFVNSMSDLFHESIPVEWIAEVWARMSLASWHRFQVLTKRARRMQQIVGSEEFRDLCWTAQARRAMQPRHSTVLSDVDRLNAADGADEARVWPVRNIDLGVSIESLQYTFRARYLRATPAAVRFVSAEPLLGPVTLADYLTPTYGRIGLLDGRIDWVIVGGESGPRARRMEPEWAERIAAECAAAGAAFFFKQAGAVLGAEWGCSDRKGGDESRWPTWATQDYPT